MTAAQQPPLPAPLTPPSATPATPGPGPAPTQQTIPNLPGMNNDAMIDLLKNAIFGAPEARLAQEKQDQAKLLRDIQQIVHNELAADKGITASAQAFFKQNEDGSSTYSDGSEAEKQGCEMYGVRPKWCPKNMDDYVRKDSIPCWGCSLDY